ncbi:MAG: hypothetical protein H6738_16790 [Alphaproteobacteria bacterium]|nr:hypothetical protein [Alphaproteobacteria bacterium]MCB9698440.1 hypothetical protein [Alphaproteobacteria bacterium]
MWERLQHAYGAADDIPGTLAALRSHDPAVRADARWWLRATLVHQGTRYTASAAAVPPMVGAAEDPEVQERAAILDLLADLAVGAADGWWATGVDPDAEAPEVVAVQRALAAQHVRLTDLLDDADPAVRAGAARVLSVVPAVADAVRDAAVARAGDPDPVVRAAMLLAAGLADRSSGEGLAADVLRAGLVDADPRVTAAAGAALGEEGIEACARCLVAEPSWTLPGLGWFGGDLVALTITALDGLRSLRDARVAEALLHVVERGAEPHARRALRPAFFLVTDRLPPIGGWSRAGAPEALRRFATAIVDRPELGEPELWPALADNGLPRTPDALRAWAGREAAPSRLDDELGREARNKVGGLVVVGDGGPTVSRRIGDAEVSFVARAAVPKHAKTTLTRLAKLLAPTGAEGVRVLLALAEERDGTLFALSPVMDKVAAGEPEAVLLASEAASAAYGGHPPVRYEERGTVTSHQVLVVVLGLACRAAKALGRVPDPAIDACIPSAASSEVFAAELARWIELVPPERAVGALAPPLPVPRGPALEAALRRWDDAALGSVVSRADPLELLATLTPQRALQLEASVLARMEAHLAERERWMKDRLVAELLPLAELLAARHPKLRSRWLGSTAASERLRRVLGQEPPAPVPVARIAPVVGARRSGPIDPARELSYAVVDLLIEEPLFGHLLGRIDRVFTDLTPTMGLAIESRGRIALLVNPEWFVTRLSTRRVRVGALRHEVLHLVLEHPFREDLRHVDLLLYGTAADLVTNHLGGHRWPLPADARRAPWDGVEADDGATVRSVYDLLLARRVASGEASSDEIWHSDHRFWRLQRDGQSVAGDDLLEASGRVDAWVEEAFRVIGGDVTHGLEPGVLASVLAALERRKATLDWRRVLRMFAASSRRTVVTHTLKHPSRRYGTLPGLRIRRFHRLAVAVDTSGSIRDEDLQAFFVEIEGIWRSGSEIVVIECDARVQAAWRFEGRRPGAVHGRGGTDFEPVMQWLHRAEVGRFDALVYLTDGEAGAPSTRPPCPVLWVVTLRGTVGEHLRFGRTVRLAV